jgi:2-polyprenyl-3-methyl-5-hydroxy-6-metoxy-1,4-benzoquinol methylase
MATLEQPQSWGNVSGTLADEKVKVRVYDDFLFQELMKGEVRDAAVLDYGSGPAVFAKRMQDAGADISIFDSDERMQKICAEKLGESSVCQTQEDVRRGAYDIVTCNLVLCINRKDEVRRIMETINAAVRKQGDVYVGFCNPILYDVKRTQLDLRQPTGDSYRKHHTIYKRKIEIPDEEYNLYDLHRPIYWYAQQFRRAGLEVVDTHFTPESEIEGKKINDFIIFELTK